MDSTKNNTNNSTNNRTNNKTKKKRERKYRRITWTERLIIEKQYNSTTRPSYSAIARLLNRSVSAIRYEIKKGIYQHRDWETWEDVPKYSADIAQQKTDWEATSKGQMLKLGNNYAYAKYVSAEIKQGNSPETIVQTLRRKKLWTVSTPTLYRYIDEGLIPEVTNSDLWEKPKRKRKYNKVKRASRPPQGFSIENRPLDINCRTTAGHWEIDCVIGKSKGHNESVLTLTERKTRYEIILKLKTRTAKEVTAKLKQIVKRYPFGTFQSITADNGSEFSDYEALKKIVPQVYYCHPYCSSERGTNERHNRMIRRFFPKRQSMKKRKQSDCDQVATYMNNMPRRILAYQTPQEAFTAFLATLGK